MTRINKSKRVTIQIPKGTKIHEFLSKNNNMSKWELLEHVITQLPESKEDRSILIFNTFVQQLSELFPETKANLEKLRPLIFKWIIKKEPLDPWYYEELKQA